MNRIDTDTGTRTRWVELFRGGRGPRLIAFLLAVWLHASNSMLVVTTLPSVVAEIGGDAYVGWAFTLYLLASILMGVITGLLVMRMGLRRAFLCAGGLFVLGCAIAAMAPSMPFILIGRFVQGMGGGWQLALVYVALARLFPNHLMPRLMALVSSAWGASAFMGPLVGGIFATYSVWRLAYWAYALQALVFVILVWFAVPPDSKEDRDQSSTHIPGMRLLLLATGVLLISLLGAEPDSLGVPLMAAAAVLLFGIFLWQDARSRDKRLLPPRPFLPTTASGAGFLMVLALSIGTMSLLVYGSFFLERLFGFSPFTAGYIITAESVAWTVAAILFANVGQDTERWLIRIGALAVTLGVAGLAVTMPQGEVWFIVPFILLPGAGFGAMWGFAMRRVVAAAPRGEHARVSATIPAVQQFGFAIGAATAAVIANSLGFAEDAPAETLRTVAFWTFAGFVPVTLVGCWCAWRLSQPLAADVSGSPVGTLTPPD